MLRGAEQADCGIGAVICGVRCDAIVFNAHDVEVICEGLGSDSYAQRRVTAVWLSELRTHFVPEVPK